MSLLCPLDGRKKFAHTAACQVLGGGLIYFSEEAIFELAASIDIIA